VAALAAGVSSAFPTALEDRLHQPHRAPLIPGLDEILRLRAPGLLGCALSGAGPSVLVFHERGHEQVSALVQQIFAMHGHASEIVCNTVARDGCQISEDDNRWI
jgi:homoserine kinase